MDYFIEYKNKPFSLFPQPLLLLIYSFNTPSSYCSYRLTCKNWSEIFRSVMATNFLKRLAHSYRTGTGGVIQNRLDAIFLYQILVTQQNDHEAEAWLAFCYLKGENREHDKEVFRLSTIGVEKGIPLAFRNLGVCYSDGRGVEKNLKKAIQLHQQGVELGDSYSQNALGFSYQSGEGVKKDIHEAIRLYKLAVDQGNAIAQTNLGYCYEYGIGVKEDAKKASSLYRLAALQGNSHAQFNLGMCYEEGYGVVKNLDEACVWFEKSAQQGDADAKARVEELRPNQ